MIRWDEIAKWEGGMQLSGYVPGDARGQSGVTVAAGVDLGRLTRDEVALLPPAVQAKIHPYVSQRGGAAKRLLAAHPLTITADEGQTLMALKGLGFLKSIRGLFKHNGTHAFDTLPDGAMTVIMSVTWQYGNPWDDPKCGTFWPSALKCDWSALAAVLRDFPDTAYISRRRDEAKFLLANAAVYDGKTAAMV